MLEVILTICAVFVCASTVARFGLSFAHKKPLWTMMCWSFLEIICCVIILESTVFGG